MFLLVGLVGDRWLRFGLLGVATRAEVRAESVAHAEAAVDGDDRAGDVAGRVGAEEGHDGATSSGLPSRPRGTVCSAHVRQSSGRPSVMAVTIGPGATTLQVMPRAASSRATARVRPDQPGLGRRVVGLAGLAGLAAHRRHVDDAAEAAPHHLGGGPADGVERAGEVGAAAPRPTARRSSASTRPSRGDAGVVHQQLDRPERAPRSRAKARSTDVGVGDVGLHGERLAARRLDRGLRLLGAVVVGRVAERDPMARPRRARPRWRADARGAAGDERDATR